MPEHKAIEVIEASTHNLREISCRIPHGQLTVVTGLSGAGKSSLAFDTIYAEAQRRFVESMSTYARQFLEQMERPPMTAMNHVLPAVALEARNPIRNARTTVATQTEVHDVLRLLLTHLGEARCPNGHGTVISRTPQEATAHLLASYPEEQVTLLASLPRPTRLANEKLKELIRQGYFRRFEDGEVVRMPTSQRWLKTLDPLPLVLGRFRLRDSAQARIGAAVEEGYSLAGGVLQVLTPNGIQFLGRALTCGDCGARVERPTPALFSFNSPLGACPTCQGFGRVMGIDPQRVFPDPSKSLEEKPIAPWNSPARLKYYPKLLSACRQAGIPTNVPWRDLTEEQQRFVWSGSRGFTSLDRFFARLERKIYRVHVRVLLARYRSYDTCPDCQGDRLRPEGLAVRLAGRGIAELTAMSVEQLRSWLSEQTWPRGRQQASSFLIEQLSERLETLDRVGLGYLTLDRQARSLSGGESQRIHLASALGSGLTGTLYVLDEPTIGLHPQDSDKLLSLLRDLADRGNTVLVVEHDRTLIEGADHVIDLGPLAGEHGGEVIAEGDIKAILSHPTSLTARYMNQRPANRKRAELTKTAAVLAELPRVEIHGAKENNLRGFDVAFPKGALVAVTGVSGSGKSTLIENVLHGTYQRARGVVDVEPGECERLSGLDDLEDVILVDQRPLGRSSRSNPVTYTKAYDEIRKLFAASPDAQRRGIEAGHFSFNLDRGRCPECQGTGSTEVDMQFMAPVTVVCDSCAGKRFKPEILAVRVRERNIYETLEMTVSTALEVFADRKALCRKLQSLADVGLSYLRLGQSTSTLSGGEAQRLKLASFLDRRKKQKPRLFLFDEPTTGLHMADIDLLHSTFRQLMEQGHGVLVVEHSTDLLARVDWIVDLGPGGGVRGGDLLFSGPLSDFLDGIDSPTAVALRKHLRWRRRRQPSS